MPRKGSESQKYTTVSVPSALLESLKTELEDYSFISHGARVKFVIQQFLLKRGKGR